MIVGVAFKHKETEEIVSLPKPHRHNDLFRIKPSYFLIGSFEQGFIDEDGRFYDRKQAAYHAWKAGQILLHRRSSSISILTSEDLW